MLPTYVPFPKELVFFTRLVRDLRIDRIEDASLATPFGHYAGRVFDLRNPGECESGR